LQRISDKFNKVFNGLAELKAELTLDESAPMSDEFLDSMKGEKLGPVKHCYDAGDDALIPSVLRGSEQRIKTFKGYKGKSKGRFPK